jgi:transposase-like protein
MLGERGVEVDHTTLYRWTQRYAPELEKRTAWYRSRLSFSWRVDETYVRVKGHWKYLYRAIDKDGATLDFYLADRRNTKAAKRFLAAALKRSRDLQQRSCSSARAGAARSRSGPRSGQGRAPP